MHLSRLLLRSPRPPLHLLPGAPPPRPPPNPLLCPRPLSSAPGPSELENPPASFRLSADHKAINAGILSFSSARQDPGRHEAGRHEAGRGAANAWHWQGLLRKFGDALPKNRWHADNYGTLFQTLHGMPERRFRAMARSDGFRTLLTATAGKLTAAFPSFQMRHLASLCRLLHRLRPRPSSPLPPPLLPPVSAILAELDRNAPRVCRHASPAQVAEILRCLRSHSHPPANLVAGVEAAAGFFARAGEPGHQAFLFHELAAAAPLLPPAPAWPGVPFPAFLSLFSATGASLIARADSPATISTALRAASLLPPPARAGCLPLFARAAERGGMLFGAGSAFEITRALAAAADAGADAPGMAGEADERAGARLAGGRGGDVAAAAGAFARVGCGAPRFFRGVAGGAGRLGGELGAGGLCGVVHAMAVLGHAKAHEQALRELWAGALGFLMKHGEAVSEPMRAQLYEAMVLAEADGVELPSPARAAVEDLDGGWRVEGALPDAGIFDPKSGDFD
ncbi:hypothetical protein TeGR_g9319, partial [Tetraparma gracilis]